MIRMEWSKIITDGNNTKVAIENLRQRSQKWYKDIVPKKQDNEIKYMGMRHYRLAEVCKYKMLNI